MQMSWTKKSNLLTQVLGGKSTPSLEELYRPLRDAIAQYLPPEQVDLVRKAFLFAEQAHGAQMRASGDPYITHPLAVAQILADIKVDVSSLMAALLHDTLEDTQTTFQVLQKEFGEDVACLVDGVTKLSRIEEQSDVEKQAESFRKLVLAMSSDLRVLLVKLADRLHNMRTLSSLPSKERRECIARETKEIYAPLAERIGIHAIKDELQDLAFKELHQEAHAAIVVRLERMHKTDPKIIQTISQDLRLMLRESGLRAEVTGREKTPFSIWRKMQKKNVNFEQLSDIIGFRVLVDSVADSYQALGVIHHHSIVVPGKFKDYISTPKPNHYQALHTTVIGPKNNRLEIQICTHQMRDVAEYGVAAHWQYKQGMQPTRDGAHFRWVRGLLDILKTSTTPEDFLEHTKLEMFQDQVFCFTPNGDLIALPRGATPVDFAYAVHSDVGNHCSGAQINGRLMPLRTALKNGDQVEILTSKNHEPSPAWERFVVTGKARSHVRRFVQLRKREEYIALGKEMFLGALKEHRLDMKSVPTQALLQTYQLEDLETLYVKIGDGTLSMREVLSDVLPKEAVDSTLDAQVQALEAKGQRRSKQLKEEGHRIPIRGLIPGMAIHYAECCHPIPGDRIIGIVMTGTGVTIHTLECDNLKQFESEPDRWLDVDWGGKGEDFFMGRLRVTLANQPGSLGTLTTLIGQQGGNIVNLRFVRRHVDFFDLYLDIDVKGRDHLNAIMGVLRGASIISTVDRI